MRNFAVFSSQGGHYSGEREAAFHREIEALGLPVHSPPSNPSRDPKVLPDWIKVQPTPMGVFAVNDDLATDFLDACQRAGAQVPDTFAVLGVDNDDLVCETAAWPLSSITLPTRRIGETAVRMLQDLLNGNPPEPASPRLLPPGRVIHRVSTDVIASGQLAIAAAVRYIRNHRDRPVSVDDVAGHAGVSRRKFEQLLRSSLHTTPLQLIHRERIALARELLASTSLTLDQIAESSGLGSREQLSRIFKNLTGQTPAAFRTTHYTGPNLSRPHID